MIVYEATCYSCGDKLEVVSASLDTGRDLRIEVDPCKTCLEKANLEPPKQELCSNCGRPVLVQRTCFICDNDE